MTFLGWAYNALVDIGDISIIVAVFVLLPMSLFKTKRKFAGTGLTVVGVISLLNLWAVALVVILRFWGLIALLIGVIFTPIVASAIALIAASLHKDWMDVFSILVEIVLTAAAFWSGDAIQRRYEAKKAK